MMQMQRLRWVGSIFIFIGGWGCFVLLDSDVLDVAPQVPKEVPGAKLDGCPCSEVTLMMVLEGVNIILVGRVV